MECTGCGQCCLTYKCKIATMQFGDKDVICPALVFVNDNFYRCLIIQWEEFLNMEPLIKNALGIGVGCTNDTRS